MKNFSRKCLLPVAANHILVLAPWNLHGYLPPWVHSAHQQILLAPPQTCPESCTGHSHSPQQSAKAPPLSLPPAIHSTHSCQSGACKTWIMSLPSMKSLQSLLIYWEQNPNPCYSSQIPPRIFLTPSFTYPLQTGPTSGPSNHPPLRLGLLSLSRGHHHTIAPSSSCNFVLFEFILDCRTWGGFPGLCPLVHFSPMMAVAL